MIYAKVDSRVSDKEKFYLRGRHCFCWRQWGRSRRCSMWRLGWIPYLLIEKVQGRKWLFKKDNLKKKMIDGWSLKDDEIEVMHLSILKWILLSYRLRLYGEATAVVMNFYEICEFVKFAVFCVIDHPGGICGWNIDTSSESKWYVIDFVSELAAGWTYVHFIDYLM